MKFRGGGQIAPPPLQRSLVFMYPSRERVKLNFDNSGLILKTFMQIEDFSKTITNKKKPVTCV